MGFSEWAQSLDRRVLGPVHPWRETRPRDLLLLASFPAAALVVGLVLYSNGLMVGGLIGYGIGGLLIAYPAYRLRRRADRKRLERMQGTGEHRP